jgi:predicted HTH domain antitoxin
LAQIVTQYAYTTEVAMQTFSIRELRERSGDLSREAEEGRLSLVTRHGQPLFVSVPFSEELLQAGVHTALAVNLFKSGDLAPSRAAKLARMSLPQFLEYVSARGIPVLKHEPDELAEELATFDTYDKK